MKNWIKNVGLALMIFCISTLAFAEVINVDAKITNYNKTEGVAGNLNSIGSDTLNNCMTLWAEGFRSMYPNVNIQIEGKGSSTAPPALIEGTAQLAPMSRPMTSGEIDLFEQKYGFKPTFVGVALDALAVYVHKDNPIESLSIAQVDAIFSKTRKQAYPVDILNWGQVGLNGEWENMPISLYGRNSASGTYGFFKEHTLGKGDFKDTVKEQPGSASVVMGVTEDLAGIGYSGIGYKTSGVKAIALSAKDGEESNVPSYENVLKGKYPLGRMLYIYVAKSPNESLPKLTEEFLRYVLSKEGQEVVVKDGYLPLPSSEIEKQKACIE